MSTSVVYSAPLIKICGVTSVADGLACASLGVEWIGLNFHPKSPRYVDPERASRIVRELPASVKVAGVFVNLPSARVVEIARMVGLHAAQLHGDESPAHARALGCLPHIKAFRLADVAGWQAVLGYLADCEALGHKPEAVLVDAYVASEPGGTGTLIADEILANRPPLPRWIVAGGLTPENVARRVMQTQPWMVDVASGVESSPGCKDTERLAQFVRNVRSIPLAADFPHQPVAVHDG